MIKKADLEAIKEAIIQDALARVKRDPTHTPDRLNNYFIAYGLAMDKLVGELQKLGHLEVSE